MTQPTITDIFGAGATQTATTIVILKSDLPFTASATNNGEQLFAAVCKKAQTYLTAANYAANIDQSVTLGSGFDQIVYRTVNGSSQAFLQNQLQINFVKPQTSAGVTPDDY